MPFVQIMELRTKNLDEIQSLEHEWRAATEGKRTLQRSMVTRDRRDPDRYLIFAFFDSYESAMQNSNLAETTEFGRKQAAFVDGDVFFQDLDVVEDLDG